MRSVPWSSLVIAAQQGDCAAADRLARELRPHLTRFLKGRYSNPDQINDAVQDTLVRVFQHLDDLKAPGAVCAWASQIARKVYVDSAGCPVRFERKAVPESQALQGHPFLGCDQPRFTAKTLPIVAWEALDEEEREGIPDRSLPTEVLYINHIDPANRARALCRSRGRAGEVFLAVYEDGLSHKEAQERFGLRSEVQSRILCFRCAHWLKPQMEVHLAYAA